MNPRQDVGVSVHTGFPNPATDGTIRGLNLNQLLIWNSVSTFMMEITGDEWLEQGIATGDIALIDRALTPKTLDKVVWLHQDIFSVSDLIHAPKQAIIWGVVTSIVHRYRKLQ